MEGIISNNFNDIVAEPLTLTRKNDWFKCVKNYLISQNLWKVTSRSARPERYRVKDFAKWRRKNAAALHVIQISCGSRNLPLIREAFEAKVAWDILYCTYNFPPPPYYTPAEGLEMGTLYEAIYENNCPAAKAFIESHPSALDEELAATTGETPLHVAARLGRVEIVEELVGLVSPAYLETFDACDNTPLLTAASVSGVIPIAKCMINKNSKLLAIPSTASIHMVPVTMAFANDFNEMGHYLYSITPLDVFKPENGIVGPSLLTRCLATGDLDIVLDLLQQCKELLFAVDFKGMSTIECIAYNLTFSLDKTQFWFWKRCVYHYIKIPSTTTTKHFCVDIQQEGESNKANQELGFIHRLTSFIYKFSGMKETRKLKLQHEQAKDILSIVCENVKFANGKKKVLVVQSLLTAAMIGNAKFLFHVSKASPESTWLVTLDKLRYGGIFFKAVESRQVDVFNLINGFRFRNLAASKTDLGRDSLLDKAAMLAPSFHLNQIPGAALQMQSEMRWFKEVERVVDPVRKILLDKGNPMDVFRQNHKELRKEGEKWMKGTASSCSVVGGLIVTIMFAAAFTVPGGNDQTSGYPIFSKQKLFIFFLTSDALSLFCSTTSVLTFLGILNSRYAEEDFLYSLPTKLIIGLSALFLSIATMMLAFSATIIMMLQQRLHTWIVLPIIMLASVPVTVFVLLQSSLLVQIFSSTYAPVISRKKKVEMWP